jgi:hypothetical protein
MRPLVLALAVLASTFRLCGGEDDDVPNAASAPTATMEATIEEAREPAHGGVVVPVEDHQVEVVVSGDGAISAYMFDAGGQPVDIDAQVMIYVPIEGGTKRPVMLAWNRRAHVFEGRLHGVAPAPGALEVGIYVEGRPMRSAPMEMRPVVVRVEAGAPTADVAVVAPAPRGSAGVEVHVGVPPPPTLQVNVEAGVSAGGGVVVSSHRHHPRVSKRRAPQGKARGHRRAPPRGRRR